MNSISARKRILAVSSSGGHWVQLMRIRPAFDDCDVAYMTTEASYRQDLDAYAEEFSLPRPRFYLTTVANRWSKFSLLRQFFDISLVLLRERPEVVVSTGSSPGFFALRIGKLLGARTLWIDSIANTEELSLSGRKIARHADACLTQWPELATETENDKSTTGKVPRYWGAVL